MTSGADAVRTRALAAIASVAADLRARFGWTDLALDVRIADDGRIVLAGEVVAPRMRTRVATAIADAIPGRVVDDGAIALRRGATWRALPAGITEIWRRPGDPRELATELVEDDGPVESITAVGDATLVRAPDGTLGWTTTRLGPVTVAPTLGSTGPFDAAALAEVPAHWSGVRYRLGGTTMAGVDCSGLVQRAMAGIGVRIPRHSGDQLAIAPRDGEGDDEIGALVLVWTADEAACHVGLALGDGRIVHASRSRSRVVVDTRADLLGRARRLAHVSWAALVELQRRALGHSSLVTVVPIGREP